MLGLDLAKAWLGQAQLGAGPGSAGAGRTRGGFGQVIEIGSASDAPFGINAFFDRVEHPARGREGGRDGAPGAIGLASGQRLKAKGMQAVPSGERLLLELPGGAGHGDPFSRDPQAVAEDVLDELIDIDEARQKYGVVVSAEGEIDWPATSQARQNDGEKT